MYFSAGKPAVKQLLDSKESPHFISLGFWSSLAAHITASSVVHINIYLSLYIYISEQNITEATYKKIKITETNFYTLANIP